MTSNRGMMSGLRGGHNENSDKQVKSKKMINLAKVSDITVEDAYKDP